MEQMTKDTDRDFFMSPQVIQLISSVMFMLVCLLTTRTCAMFRSCNAEGNETSLSCSTTS